MALERAIDRLAVELELDPAELRRRNFIPETDFPYVTAVRERYDSGNYGKALDLALKESRYAEAREEQARRRELDDTVQLGIGVGSYVEITAPGGRQDFGAVEIGEDGTISLYSSAVSQGHSHETTFAQIVSHILKVPHESITYLQGDTGVIPQSGGTMGSRSLQIAGSAVFGATNRALHKAREVFAFHSEVALDDVVQFEDGQIGVVGVPSTATPLVEIARLAADPSNLPLEMDPGIRGEETWEQDEATIPFGTHISIVEVDIETGSVRVLRHIACDDTGTILNRMVVDGQVHGGVAQGIGQALYEKVLYDDANPISGNLTTYLIPSAGSIPLIEAHHTETPTPENPLGAKGIGEAGTIGSTPAIVNAVIDALSHYGVRHLNMPLTPQRVWEAVAAHRRV